MQRKMTDETELAKRFAAAMPIGTRCRYYPVLPSGEDEFEEMVIASEPWLLGHGAAVVKVEGRSGGVSIKHIFPMGIGEASPHLSRTSKGVRKDDSKHQCSAAIANYERRLWDAIAAAADEDLMPGVSIISGLKRDLQALYELRRDAEQKAALDRKLADIDAN